MATLHQKILEGEHQQQDFKFAINDSRKIARTLSAFANTDGGRLLIGVKDNSNISGVRSDEEIHMIEAAADYYSKPNIDIQYQHHDVNGKQVLEVIVPKSPNRPHFVNEENNLKVAYFRKDDQNFPANNVLIKYWMLQHREPKTVELKEKEIQLLTFLRAHPFVTMKRYAQLASVSYNQAENLLATFIRWGLIDWHFNGKNFEYSLPQTDE